MQDPRPGSERGAAAIEFAIIAPLLFMLIFGIIEFGLAWSQKNVYVGAAREGARYAAVDCEPGAGGGGCTNALIGARITQAAAGYPLTLGDLQVQPARCATAGGAITVHWFEDFTIDIPFIPTINLNDVKIEATFRCE